MGQGIAAIVMGLCSVLRCKGRCSGGILSSAVQGAATPCWIVEVLRCGFMFTLLPERSALLVGTLPQIPPFQRLGRVSRQAQQRQQSQQPAAAEGQGGQGQQSGCQPGCTVEPEMMAAGVDGGAAACVPGCLGV